MRFLDRFFQFTSLPCNLSPFNHPTFLNISSGFYIVVVGIYTAFNHNGLAKTTNWGLIAMIGLLGVGALALVADLMIQFMVRSKKSQNQIGFCLALLIAIALLTL